MRLDLTNVMQDDGKVLETEVPFESEEISFRIGRFAVKEKSPIHLRIENTGKSVLALSGETSLSVMIPCGRCLEPVEYPFSLTLEREVDMKLTKEEREAELDEANFIEDHFLDVEILMLNELLINWPIRVLCKDDCKGICSRCGLNLNRGSCDCDQESLDPRMAAIRDIFSKFKEV